MGDFDGAMRKAMHLEFPGIRIYGCHFHLGQALVRKASEVEIGLARDIRKRGQVMKKFLAFAALALLPNCYRIEATFELCAQDARGGLSGENFFLWIVHVHSF